MAVSTPKYVYSALVTDKYHPLQLMAYAIYKSDKTEIAESLHASGMTQTQIDTELAKFHDLVLNSEGLLQNYHARARELGGGLVKQLKAGIRTDAQQDFIDRMEQLVRTEKSWHHHLGAFIADAVKGVLSTVFIIILFGGVYSIFISKDEREALYSATGKSLMDVATGEVPVADNFRAELARKKKEQQEKAAQESVGKPPVTQP